MNIQIQFCKRRSFQSLSDISPSNSTHIWRKNWKAILMHKMICTLLFGPILLKMSQCSWRVSRSRLHIFISVDCNVVTVLLGTVHEANYIKLHWRKYFSLATTEQHFSPLFMRAKHHITHKTKKKQQKNTIRFSQI